MSAPTLREQLEAQFKNLVSPAKIRETVEAVEPDAAKDLPERATHNDLAHAAARVCDKHRIIPAVLEKLREHTSDSFPPDFTPLKRIDQFDAHQVWLADRHNIGHKAVRLWPLARELDPDTRRRVEAALTKLERFEHPDVPRMSSGRVGGCYVSLTTPYYEASTIQYWLSVHAPRWRSILRLFIRIGHALAAAHEAGICHGDMRLEDILVLDVDEKEPDKFCILGFDVELGADLRQPTYPHYRAPERCMSHAPSSPKSDQFSFCVALFIALYRKHPFHRTSSGTKTGLLNSLVTPEAREAETAALCDAICNKDLSPRRSEADGPEALYDILRRGLEREPGARFPSMKALLAALESEHRRRVPRGIALLVVMLAAVGIVFYTAPIGPIVCWRPPDSGSVWREADDKAIQWAARNRSAPSAGEAAAAASRELKARADEILAVQDRLCRGDCDVYAERVACLAGRRADLRETIDVFAADPTAASRMDRILSTVAPASDCAMTTVNVCRNDSEPLRQARAAELRGDYTAAAEMAAKAVSLASGRDPAGLADASFVHGRVLAELEREAEAEVALQRAVEAADEAQCGGLAIDAANRWTKVVALRRNTSAVIPEIDLLARLERVYARELTSQAYLLRKAEAFKNRGLLRQHKQPDPACVRRGQNGCGRDYAGARGDFSRALELLQRIDPPPRAALAIGYQTLGSVLFQLGLVDASFEQFRASIRHATDAFGPDNPAAWRIHFDFGKALLDTGRVEEAGPHLASALTLATQALGDRSAKVGEANLQLAMYYQDTHQHRLSLKHAEAARSRFQTLREPSDDRPINGDRMYAAALMATGRYAEALPIRQHILGISHDARDITVSHIELAETYHAMGDRDGLRRHSTAASETAAGLADLRGEVDLYSGLAQLAFREPKAVDTLTAARAGLEEKPGDEVIDPSLWAHATWELTRAKCEAVSNHLREKLGTRMPREDGKQASALILRIYAEIADYDPARCSPAPR